MVTHCGRAASQCSRAPSLCPVKEPRLPTESILPRAHLPSLPRLLCLNGEPLLAGLQPSPTLLPLRRLPGLHRKQVKCVSEVSKTRRGHEPPVTALDLGEGNPKLEVGAGRCAPPGLLPHPGTKPGNHGKGNLVFSCFALNPFLSQSLGQLLSSPHPGPHPHRPEAASQGPGSRDQLQPLPVRPPPSWSRWSFALTLEHSGTCLWLGTPWSRALWAARLRSRLPDHSLVALTARPPAPTALLPRWRWPYRWPGAAMPAL